MWWNIRLPPSSPVSRSTTPIFSATPSTRSPPRRRAFSSAGHRPLWPRKLAGEDWTATEERGRLVYQDEAGLLDLPAPKLYGRHQFENAGLAIAALRAIKPFKISPAAYEVGMIKAD